MRIWAFIVVFGVSSGAFAQHQGTVGGIVVDAAKKTPLEDVVVTVTSPALQGERLMSTDGAGGYQVSQLPPGVYVLRFERAGFRPFARDGVVLRAEQVVKFDAQLLPTTIEVAPVVVDVKAPTVDVGSTTAGLNVTREFIAMTPFLQPNSAGVRTADNAALAAPQTIKDDFGVSYSGAQSPEHRYVVDGVSSNDPSLGTNGTQFPVEFIEDLSVITDGYQAEFGHATGGALNVVTKSGSNEFHGSIWGNWTPGALSGTPKEIINRASVLSTTRQLWNSGDVGLEVGGPIVKDKLWFYAGFSPSVTRTKATRNVRAFVLNDDGSDFQRDDFGKPVRELLPDATQTRFEDERAYSYLGKLTYRLAANHTLTLSAIGSVDTAITPRAFAPLRLSGQVDSTFANTTALSYAGSFLDKHLLVDATLGWHHQDRSSRPTDGTSIGSTTGAAGTPQVDLRRENFEQGISGYTLADVETLGVEAQTKCDAAGFTTTRTTTVDNQQRFLLRCPVTGSGSTYSVGGFGALEDAALDRLSAKASVTLFGNLLGHHTLKVGGDFEHLRYDVLKAVSGGTWLAENSTGTRVDDFRRFGVLTGPDAIATLQSVRSTPTSVGVGAFAQDSWNVMDQVTLNLGLRYETQQLFGGDGKLGLALNSMFSPRLGLIYDFTKKGRSKIYAHYARLYETVPLNIADRALTGEYAAGYRYNTQGCDPVRSANGCLGNRASLSSDPNYDINQAAQIFGNGKTAVDPGIRPQSADEFVAGGEYEIIDNGRVGVSYTRRWMNDVIEDLSLDEGATYFLGNPGSGLATSFPKATRDYDAITLSFSKGFSDGWLAQGSYTWSYLRGNYNGLFVPETGQIDPNTNSDFDLVSQLANRTGPLAGDRTHVVKLFVAKEFIVNKTFSFTVGLSYFGQSGTPINYLASHPVFGANESFVLPRGSGGRTPFTHDVNAKLTATYKLTPTNALTFSADVFNLFNLQEAAAVDETFSTRAILPLSPAAYADRTPQQAACIAGNVPNCQSALTKTGENGVQRVTSGDLSPNYKQPVAYQKPISVRFGLRLTF